MKKYRYTFHILLFLIILFPLTSMAQSLSVGMPVLNEVYRRDQLLGKLNPDVSFTSLPLFPVEAFKVKDAFDPDSTLNKNNLTGFDGIATFDHNRGKVQLLPVIWENQYNSQHPAGFNDGVMVPARGYQTVFSAGVFLKYRFLSIQLEPELQSVQNLNFQGFYQIYGKPSPPSDIDLPERFGDSTFNKLNWGQSSIRLTFGPVSVGYSNENLWWGPGIKNALLMTDNAPGFPHVSINTVRPIKTWIGDFEAQLIGGKLVSSGYTPQTDENNWRYLNAFMLTYHPKWVPGLFLGAARSFYMYHSDMTHHLYDYLPVFGSVVKAAVGNAATDARRQDQLLSVFMRWVWVKGHGEIYAELGREDHAWNTRDIILEAAHSAAYIVGLQKLFPFGMHQGEFIQLNAEVDNLASNPVTLNRDAPYNKNDLPSPGYWYTHGQVVQGYTNDGQVLGAGIGPGSNYQWVQVKWVKGMKSLGIAFDRFVHDNDYFFANIKDVRRNWVDLGTSLVGTWDYKNLLFSGQLEYIHELNYEWRYRPAYVLNAQPSYWSPTKDTYNWHFALNVVYRF
ncbi:MAG: hypothetical protein IH595_01785 [Bacteroidales bacterium]|nr:hypothetical protein [Bacteroidales bacterium]